ncbi:MAG: peptidoglycan-binding protein [Clostridia bacterium]|nr:peptidoglycan-binding protein [Clostridia bacterium]
MAVYVGSARSDENGGAHSGKAGDQKNGKEVSTQKWYKHSKGWRVFRAKDPAARDKIAAAMEAACNNNKIGYDQWQRHTLYKAAQKVGFDISKVKTACETDCSALVRTCLAYAGIKGIPESFRTYNMPSAMLKTGKIAELKGSKYTDQSTYLGRGDILVTPVSGHTVVVLDNGAKYEPGAVPPPKEYELGERILRNGDEGKDVMQLQSYLVDLGYDLGDFGKNNDGIDGDFGDATEIAVRKFQKAEKLEDDGEYGPKSHKALMKIIEVVNSTPPVDTEVKPKTVTISGGNCYVRTAPNTSGNKLGVAYAGDKLTYQGQTAENGWHLVEFKNQNAWVSGKYGKLEA